METFVTVLIILAIAFIAGFVVVLIWNTYISFHMRRVFANHMKILHAIDAYREDMAIKRMEPKVDYLDVPSIDHSYRRFWDWGYKHILSPDKFQLIEKYIAK